MIDKKNKNAGAVIHAFDKKATEPNAACSSCGATPLGRVIVIDESVIVTYWLRKIVSVVVIKKGHRWVTLICFDNDRLLYC